MTSLVPSFNNPIVLCSVLTACIYLVNWTNSPAPLCFVKISHQAGVALYSRVSLCSGTGAAQTEVQHRRTRSQSPLCPI
jgi:hypothetical protein